jgi:hypothetical protein
MEKDWKIVVIRKNSLAMARGVWETLDGGIAGGDVVWFDVSGFMSMDCPRPYVFVDSIWEIGFAIEARDKKSSHYTELREPVGR